MGRGGMLGGQRADLHLTHLVETRRGVVGTRQAEARQAEARAGTWPQARESSDSRGTRMGRQGRAGGPGVQLGLNRDSG